mgnify:CR=1 FL=1
MSKNMLSIIIPAYNEEYRITRTLLDIKNTLSGQFFDYEILVVNDGSLDNTVFVVEKLKKQIPKLRLIDNNKNHGKGFAVKEGMLKASGDFRLFMDADNSTKVSEIIKILPYFARGFDIIIGSRRLPDSKVVIEHNWVRDFLGSVFRMLVRVIVPLGVTDSQCGFKIFTKKAANMIFPEQSVLGWAFDVEILAIARKNKLKIKEVPVVWENNADSQMNFSGMVKSFFEIIKIRLKLWRIK